MAPLSEDPRREPDDPQQPVERVAHAQRLELPRQLEQPLYRSGEAQDRDQHEEHREDPDARGRARGRREDIRHRLGAAPGQLIAVDDALGRLPAPQLRRHAAGDDGQRDRGRERAGGQGDGAVEPRHLLEPADHAKHELRPQPERQRPYDALAAQLLTATLTPRDDHGELAVADQLPRDAPDQMRAQPRDPVRADDDGRGAPFASEVEHGVGHVHLVRHRVRLGRQAQGASQLGALAGTRVAWSCSAASTAPTVSGSGGMEIVPSASGAPTGSIASPGSHTVTSTARRPGNSSAAWRTAALATSEPS